jgi:L-rhamnose isomerase
MDTQDIEKNYQSAKKIYMDFGVDTDKVLEIMKQIPVSVHCWQGDDVAGFEKTEGLSGGLVATGNYPGKATTPEQLRQDIEMALSLIPGKHKINLHSIYGENYKERDKISINNFKNWLNWAKQKELGIDFNPTFFSHSMADSGYTLSSQDKKIRDFWISHAKDCREIAYYIGKELGIICIHNIWIPDGSKDIPADRISHRKILKDSLDEILSEKYDRKFMRDSLESKLFGIGSESYVVGAFEFYYGYGLKNNIMLCLDTGHFHPTESIADKISSVLLFQDEMLLHISRGVRWDSDHVVILNDDIISITQEIKRYNVFDRVHFSLDYFDASINRITAWVIGAQALLKAILFSLLEPTHLIQHEEKNGNFGNRLALMENFKMLPFAFVWDKFCSLYNVPIRNKYLDNIKAYEESVLLKRK